jgi:uncharacterized integral membrane protein
MVTTVRDDETVTRPAGFDPDDGDAFDRDAVTTRRHDRAVRRDEPRGMFTFALRVALATLVLAAIVVFAAVNTEDVRPDFLFDTETVPFWTVVAGSAFAGFVLGQLLHRRH